LGAPVAAAIQHQLVIVHLESERHQRREVSGAPVQFEGLPAVAALKVVMVDTPRSLVSDVLTGQNNGYYAALVKQRPQGAVHRRNPH
jgi:hypothetical protein